MKSAVPSCLLLGIVLLFNVPLSAQENNNQIIKSKIEKNMQPVLIDKFFVPANAKEEFIKQMNYNYNSKFIKKSSGVY